MLRLEHLLWYWTHSQSFNFDFYWQLVHVSGTSQSLRVTMSGRDFTRPKVSVQERAVTQYRFRNSFSMHWPTSLVSCEQRTLIEDPRDSSGRVALTKLLSPLLDCSSVHQKFRQPDKEEWCKMKSGAKWGKEKERGNLSPNFPAPFTHLICPPPPHHPPSIWIPETHNS